MGSTIHCWNISESGSISNSDVGNDASLAKQKADEATLAMGCGHSSKAGHGGTYYTVSYTHLTLPTNREE